MCKKFSSLGAGGDGDVFSLKVISNTILVMMFLVRAARMEAGLDEGQIDLVAVAARPLNSFSSCHLLFQLL